MQDEPRLPTESEGEVRQGDARPRRPHPCLPRQSSSPSPSSSHPLARLARLRPAPSGREGCCGRAVAEGSGQQLACAQQARQSARDSLYSCVQTCLHSHSFTFVLAETHIPSMLSLSFQTPLFHSWLFTLGPQKKASVSTLMLSSCVHTCIHLLRFTCILHTLACFHSPSSQTPLCQAWSLTLALPCIHTLTFTLLSFTLAHLHSLTFTLPCSHTLTTHACLHSRSKIPVLYSLPLSHSSLFASTLSRTFTPSH